jgi:hypothetical protein
MSTVQTLVDEFTSRLGALLESQALERARLAVESALGGFRGGHPPKLAAVILGGKPRKKAPKQLCPVPGCKNLAAPVFGMVCAEHKNVAKAKIKKYREARRAAKLGAKASKATPAKSKKKRSAIARKPAKSPKRATKKAAAKKRVARGKGPKKGRPTAAPKTMSPSAAGPPAAAAA